MIIEPLSQIGLARHLRVTIDDITFETPNVVSFFINHLPDSVPATLFSFSTSFKLHEDGFIKFPRADNIPYKNIVKKSNGAALVIGSPEELLKDVDIVFTIVDKHTGTNYRRMLERILKIREKMREDSILYLSGIFDPKSLPLLYYFGVDLVDNSFFVSKKSFEKITEYMVKISKKVRKLIDNKTLRDFLEIAARMSQYNASMLKVGEKKYYKELERGFPVLREKKVTMTIFEEALHRPDIRRYIERIQEDYIPPKSRRILLLIPCSYKKPYSTSKTHRALLRTLQNLQNKYSIHEVIVTSPLGAVPRELEYVYPAQYYDVPVTGSWSEEEIKVILKSVKKIISRGNYEAIVAHVPEDYEFLSELGDVLFTSKGRITEESSLKNLAKTLTELSNELDYIPRSKYMKESIIGVLSFQFRSSWKTIEFDRIVGRSLSHSRIFYKNVQVGSFDTRRGYYSLTLEGAKMLLRSGKYWVKIDDFIPKGNVFSVGILDADDDIREGDEVVVIHEDELRAVGIAKMSGRLMRESSKGSAIKVRHYVRKA